MSKEITDVWIDEAYYLKLIYNPTPDTTWLFDKGVGIPYYEFTDPESNMTMWYTESFKDALLNHPTVKSQASKHKVLTKEDIDRVLIGGRQIPSADVLTVTTSHEVTKKHTPPFWANDWRKRK